VLFHAKRRESCDDVDSHLVIKIQEAFVVLDCAECENGPMGVEDQNRMLARLLRVLEAFDAESPELAPSKVARRTGLAVPTAHRLVKQMAGLGFLEATGTGTYRVGVKLWELASRSQNVLSLREAAKPYLDGVHHVVKQHTQLGVREGHDMLYIEILSNQDAVINITKVASRLPIHSCSSGLVMLAFSSPALQEEVIHDATLVALTEHTMTKPKELRRALAQVRREGFCLYRGAVHPDAAGVAVPVRGAGGSVVATISVIVPNDRRHPAYAVPVMLAAGRGLSQTLRARQSEDGAF